jgi:hypothetical protein
MKANQIQDELARKLREEAMADSPQFSPLLHARIMQQVSAEHAPTQIRPASPWRISRFIPVFSAAAIAIITATIWIHYQQSIKPPNVAVIPSAHPSLPEITWHFPALTEPANSPLTEARYGYLDRDAKNVAHYVMEQFDVLPTPPLSRRG